jgi:outer membrane biosynthesis protein TonB
MEYREQNNYPKAYLATAIIMGILFALSYFIVFNTPPKQDEGTGGILVNYGTTDEGMGTDVMSVEEVSRAEKANKSRPDKVTPTESTEKANDESSDKKIVTQNTEDAPVVATNSKKASTTIATDAKKSESKPVVNQNALYKGKKTTGTGAGDGTTGTAGNQGSVNGSNLSDNYGPGGSGSGLSLPHWNYVNPPDVKNVHRLPGVVVIDFTIDNNGVVLDAHANKSKTKATLDQIQDCEEAIRNTKFHSSTPVSGNTKGEYAFILKVY